MDNKNKNPNVPNLRFKSFSGNWNKYCVSELLESVTTNSLTWDDLNYESGIIKNIHYGLIHKGFSETCISDTNSLIPWINEEKTLKNYTLVGLGDLILADASEDRKDVGKPIEVIDTHCATVSGLHTIHAKDKTDCFIPGYKGFYFQSSSMKNQIYKIANGSKIYGISPNAFNELYMSIPNKNEQAKIVDLLIKIEERISTQNKIIEDYLSLKKCIINELCNNVDEYTECFVSDISSIGRGRVISSKEINKQLNPKYPVYSSQTSNDGIMGYLDQYDFDGEYITWTTDGANAGTVYYRNGKFNCTNVCGTLKINEENDAFFVSKLLSCLTYSYVSRNLANHKLMNNTMAKIKLKLPPLNKQREFANIIRKIEQKMHYEKEMLRLLKTQKEYFLKNLFI